MTAFDIALLAAAGFAAGTLNAIAGGGTIFTFSALLVVGISPLAANATSAAAVVLGSVASTAAYRREVMAAARRLFPLCLISVVGGCAGAILLLWSGDRVFRSLVPWLLLVATLLFAGAPRIQQIVRNSAGMNRYRGDMRLVLPAQGLVSVYGGYFGAGMGVMMLATLSLAENSEYHAVNAAKNLLAIVLQSIAVIVFLVSGIVHLQLSLLIAITSIVGGWLGVFAARRVPETYIRCFVVASGIGLSLWYFFN